MKKKIFTFAVMGCMAGIILAGCGKKPEQTVEGAKQELRDAKADYLLEDDLISVTRAIDMNGLHIYWLRLM